MAEIRSSQDFEREDLVVREQLVAHLERALRATLDFPLDALQPELRDWLHASIVHRGFGEAERFWNQKQIKSVALIAHEMSRQILEASFDEHPASDLRNFDAVLRGMEEEYKDALTTGLPELDATLAPAAHSGALFLGNSTALLAATDFGKTTMCVTLALANALLRKHVLLVTHQQTNRDIVVKLYCAALGVDVASLLSLYKSERGAAVLQHLVNFLSQYVTHYHLANQGVTVEQVVAVIRKAQREKKAATGQGYALVLDDYPGCLTTELAQAGKWGLREIQGYVFNSFVQLGPELNAHMFLPLQANREGTKAADAEDRLLTKAYVGGSYETVQVANNILVGQRPPRAHGEKWVGFLVDKSKSGPTGDIVVVRSHHAISLMYKKGAGALVLRNVVDRIPDDVSVRLSWMAQGHPAL